MTIYSVPWVFNRNGWLKRVVWIRTIPPADAFVWLRRFVPWVLGLDNSFPVPLIYTFDWRRWFGLEPYHLRMRLIDRDNSFLERSTGRICSLSVRLGQFVVFIEHLIDTVGWRDWLELESYYLRIRLIDWENSFLERSTGMIRFLRINGWRRCCGLET